MASAGTLTSPCARSSTSSASTARCTATTSATALTGISRRQLTEAAEDGFPYLPSGCHVELDRQAREWVIRHLKEAVTGNAPALRREMALLVSQFETRHAPPLDAFLEHAGVELEDVAKVGWTALKRSVDLDWNPGDMKRYRALTAPVAS